MIRFFFTRAFSFTLIPLKKEIEARCDLENSGKNETGACFIVGFYINRLRIYVSIKFFTTRDYFSLAAFPRLVIKRNRIGTASKIPRKTRLETVSKSFSICINRLGI